MKGGTKKSACKGIVPAEHPPVQWEDQLDFAPPPRSSKMKKATAPETPAVAEEREKDVTDNDPIFAPRPPRRKTAAAAAVGPAVLAAAEVADASEGVRFAQPAGAAAVSGVRPAAATAVLLPTAPPPQAQADGQEDNINGELASVS